MTSPNRVLSVPLGLMGPASPQPGVSKRTGEDVTGKELSAGAPGVRWEIGEIITTDSTVVVRTEVTGTHLGDFFGIPATGDIIRMTVVDIVRLMEGKIAEHWGTPPPLGLNGRAMPSRRSLRHRREDKVSGP